MDEKIKQEPSEIESRVMGKVKGRIIPFLFLIYILVYLTRVNVGFASLQMDRVLQFDPRVYGLGTGIFFIGYIFLQVPGNLLVERIGARRWIAPLMVLNGILVMAMALIKNASTFYVLRFLLGAVQAGIFPGLILYLTYWIPKNHQARAMAFFLTANAASGVVGGPVSGLLLKMDGILGLYGWQWIFIIEAIPSIILGALVYRVMTDRPGHASWLTEQEKSWLEPRVDTPGHKEGGGFGGGVKNPDVWIMGFCYFFMMTGFYGVIFWLPKILKDGFSNLSDPLVDALCGVPFLVAAAGMVIVGHVSDKKGKRIPYVLGFLLASAVTLTAAGLTPNPYMRFVFLCAAAFCIWGIFGPFWALPSTFLSGTAAAAGIAIINTIGNVGGFSGSYVVGLIDNRWHDYSIGLYFLAGSMIVSAVLAGWMYRRSHQ